MVEVLLISNQYNKQIILAVNASPDRADEAREEIKKSRGRIEEFIKEEQNKLNKIFPQGDHPIARRGCCGQ